MYNLIFTHSNIKTQKMEEDPLTGEDVLVDISTISYNELPTTGLNINIRSIKPQIEDGILKSLLFEITKFDHASARVKNISEDSRTAQTRTNSHNSFMEQLIPNQKNVIEELINKINDYNDPRIYFEDDHRAHFAIKYNKGRSKAWLVIKRSGANLFLWVRVDPNKFNDLNNLSQPYRDDSKTHGNRKIKLTSENLNDTMDLVHQSYEFRKLDNFYENYTKVVQEKLDDLK